MYTNFFGLRCLPFEDRADPQFFFPTAESEEALAAVEYEAHYGEGLALVVGAAGTGKTLLIRTLMSRLNSNDRAVIITWPASGALDLIRDCCKVFGVTVGSSHKADRRLNRLRRHLQRATTADQRAILILDQAEHLSPENMGELATLSDLHSDQGKLLTIILVGQPQFRTLLEKPEFSRLRQQLYGERTLSPLSLSDTQEYVRYRLRAAGAGDPDLFDVQAIALIHEASGGVPRLINHICNAALVAAYGAETTHISHTLIEEVTRKSAYRVQTLDVREVGVKTAGQVAAGWPEALARQPGATVGNQVTPVAAGVVADGSLAGGGDDVAHVRENCYLSATGYALERSTVAANEQIPLRPYSLSGGEFVDGTMLHERLEKALARAERMTATTEATLAQFTAVEKYLGSLLDRAEKVVGGLQPTVQEGARQLDETQTRLNKVLGDTERSAGAIEARLRKSADLMSDTEGQAHRIEEVCERAEGVESRLTSSAEQIADKADEVRGHVTHLMKSLEDAQRAQVGLTELIDGASTVTVQVDKKLDAFRGRLDAMAEEASSREGDAERRLEALTGKLKSIVESAERFEKQLTDASAERFRTKLAEQAEIIRCSQEEALANALAESDLKLKGLIDASAVRVEEFRRKLEQHQSLQEEKLNSAITETDAKLQAAIGDAEANTERIRTQLEVNQRSSEKKLGSTIAESDANLQAVIGEAQAKVDRIRTELEEHQCLLQEKLDSSVTGGNERLQAVVREVETQVDRTCARSAAAQGSLQEALSKAIAQRRAEVETMSGEAESRVVDLQRQLGLTERKSQEIRTSIAHSTAGVDEAAARLNDLENALQGVHSSVVELTERSEMVTDSLSQELDRGERMIQEIRPVCEEVQTLKHQVSASLVEIGMGCERASAARKQVEECERITAGFTQDTSAGRELAADLHQLIAAGGEVSRLVEGKVAEVNASLDRLDEQRASTGGVLERLEEAGTVGHKVIDQATASTLAAEQAVRNAREQVERLSSAETSANQAAERLDAVVGPADQMHEALTGLVAHADEKINRMNSHHAAARQIVERLSEANITAHEAIEQWEASQRMAVEEVEKSRAKMEQLMKEVASLTGQTEGTAKELAAKNAEASELLYELKATTKPASQIAADLNQAVEDADRAKASITEDCEKASSLAERLNTVSQVLATAKTIGASVQKSVDQAKELSGRLGAITDRAGKQCTTLQDLEAKNQGMIDTQKQLAAETEEAVKRFAERLDSAQAGEQLVTELLTQTESLGREVYELQRRAIEAEARITEAAAVPQELLESVQAKATQLEHDLHLRAAQAGAQIKEAMAAQREAVESSQAQAAQLEQVCAAVRRVFAGLSKASLEAKQQTDQLRGTGTEAANRIAHLTSETDRASRTLNQWVQEAIQAQSRLEQTLGACPSITNTHPSDSLAGVSRTIKPFPRIANPSAGGGLSVLSQPADGKTPCQEPSDEITKPATRAEEISRLIEEARQAGRGDSPNQSENPQQDQADARAEPAVTS